jgi:hypothetical protein
MKQIQAGLALLILIVFGPTVFAQGTAQSPSTAKSAGSATSDVNDKNVQEYIDLLRADVRQQKAQIMGAVMELNADQAAKFWPVYNEYDVELSKLNKLRVENIEDYANSYDQMTDAKADQLIRNAITYRKQRLELLAKYYDRVKAALGPIQAARFVQIEDQLLMLIDLQIASALPIATATETR